MLGTHTIGHTIGHTTDHTIDHTIDGYILSKPKKAAWSGLEEPGYQVGISGEVFSVSGGYKTIAFLVKNRGYWLVRLWLL